MDHQEPNHKVLVQLVQVSTTHHLLQAVLVIQLVKSVELALETPILVLALTLISIQQSQSLGKPICKELEDNHKNRLETQDQAIMILHEVAMDLSLLLVRNVMMDLEMLTLVQEPMTVSQSDLGRQLIA